MKPSKNEYAPYYQKYLDQVEGDDALLTLAKQIQEMEIIFTDLTEEKALFAYAEGKWTIKELIGHMIDTERVFSYRAMCIARSEQQPLPGFEQDDFVAAAHFNKRDVSSLAEEYRHLRQSNLALYSSFSEEDLNKRGTASGNSVTVRALVFITAGHEKHHLNILRERYLNNPKL